MKAAIAAMANIVNDMRAIGALPSVESRAASVDNPKNASHETAHAAYAMRAARARPLVSSSTNATMPGVTNPVITSANGTVSKSIAADTTDVQAAAIASAVTNRIGTRP